MAMAKIEIRCEECGCTFTHTHKCYNRDAANSYEDWAREHITVCPSCYGAAKRAEERARQDAAAEKGMQAISENGIALPELTGTEKQIAWANKIRAAAAAVFAAAGAKPVAWERFAEITAAKWWIENRDYCSNARMLARRMFEEGRR